jgi:hypothetical protein
MGTLHFCEAMASAGEVLWLDSRPGWVGSGRWFHRHLSPQDYILAVGSYEAVTGAWVVTMGFWKC